MGAAAGGDDRRHHRAPALAWERHELDGSWLARVSWVQESGGQRYHKVVQVRAGSLRPLEPPEAYLQVPRRLPGRGGRNHPG